MGTTLGLVLVLAPGSAHAQSGQIHYITLQWTAPGDDGNVGRASYYELRYSTTPMEPDTASWFSAATPATGLPIPSPAGTTDSVRVQGLTPGSTYYFVIRAADEVPNWSGFSNVASGIPSTCNIPTETLQILGVTEDAGAALLTWPTPTDPVATSLVVYRGTGSSGSLFPLTTLSTGATSYLDATVNSGTTYRYQIALSSSCGEGPRSSTQTITMSGPPLPPNGATQKPTVRAYPNPSSGPVQFLVTVPGTVALDVRLRVFDPTGHVMGEVVNASFPPGQHTLPWSRTTRNGSRLAPGYYEVLGTIGTARVRERIILLP